MWHECFGWSRFNKATDSRSPRQRPQRSRWCSGPFAHICMRMEMWATDCLPAKLSVVSFGRFPSPKWGDSIWWVPSPPVLLSDLGNQCPGMMQRAREMGFVIKLGNKGSLFLCHPEVSPAGRMRSQNSPSDFVFWDEQM